MGTSFNFTSSLLICSKGINCRSDLKVNLFAEISIGNSTPLDLNRRRELSAMVGNSVAKLGVGSPPTPPRL
jgi:hypothetical protein